MTHEAPSPSANILAPGLVASLLMFLATWFASLREIPADLARAELAVYASMLLILLATQFLALRRLQAASGVRASFLQAFLHAALTGATAAAGLGFAVWLYYTAVDPEYLARFLAAYEQQLLAGDMSPAEREQATAFIAANRDFLLSPFKQAMLLAGTVLGLAMLLSPLSALLARLRVSSN